jgi:hypothetical protein
MAARRSGQRRAAVKARIESQLMLARAKLSEGQTLALSTTTRWAASDCYKTAQNLLEQLDRDIGAVTRSGDTIEGLEAYRDQVCQCLGTLHLQFDRYSESIPWFERARDIMTDGGDQNKVAEYGYALWKVGRGRDAVNVWREGLLRVEFGKVSSSEMDLLLRIF